MQVDALIQMLQLVTQIVALSVPGAGDATAIATALEQLASVVSVAYQSAAGKPIDPSIFTPEAHI